eukprot:263367_1
MFSRYWKLALVVGLLSMSAVTGSSNKKSKHMSAEQFADWKKEIKKFKKMVSSNWWRGRHSRETEKFVAGVKTNIIWPLRDYGVNSAHAELIYGKLDGLMDRLRSTKAIKVESIYQLYLSLQQTANRFFSDGMPTKPDSFDWVHFHATRNLAAKHQQRRKQRNK